MLYSYIECRQRCNYCQCQKPGYCQKNNVGVGNKCHKQCMDSTRVTTKVSCKVLNMIIISLWLLTTSLLVVLVDDFVRFRYSFYLLRYCTSTRNSERTFSVFKSSWYLLLPV